jgi:hypothetical protein
LGKTLKNIRIGQNTEKYPDWAKQSGLCRTLIKNPDCGKDVKISELDNALELSGNLDQTLATLLTHKNNLGRCHDFDDFQPIFAAKILVTILIIFSLVLVRK